MREAAVMLIVNSDGLILGVSRRYDHTKFGLPGGKVEPGEQPWESAIRETREETSIESNFLELIFKREEPATTPDGLPFYTYCYYARSWKGTPVDSEEGVVKWLTVEELTSEKGAFPDYNKRTIEAFRSQYPDVTLKGIEK